MTRRKTPAPPAPTAPPEDPADVTIYPTGTAWIADVEPVEQTVSAARAAELLEYSPAAFTTDPPETTSEPPETGTGVSAGDQVTGPVLTTVGDDGPELVAPPSSATQPADDADATPQEA